MTAVVGEGGQKRKTGAVVRGTPPHRPPPPGRSGVQKQVLYD